MFNIAYCSAIDLENDPLAVCKLKDLKTNKVVYQLGFTANEQLNLKFTNSVFFWIGLQGEIYPNKATPQVFDVVTELKIRQGDIETTLDFNKFKELTLKSQDGFSTVTCYRLADEAFVFEHGKFEF